MENSGLKGSVSTKSKTEQKHKQMRDRMTGSAIEGNAGKSLKPSEMSQQHPPKLHCRNCDNYFERKDAVQIIVDGECQIACPNCGMTRRNRTF